MTRNSYKHRNCHTVYNQPNDHKRIYVQPSKLSLRPHVALMIVHYIDSPIRNYPMPPCFTDDGTFSLHCKFRFRTSVPFLQFKYFSTSLCYVLQYIDIGEGPVAAVSVGRNCISPHSKHSLLHLVKLSLAEEATDGILWLLPTLLSDQLSYQYLTTSYFIVRPLTILSISNYFLL